MSINLVIAVTDGDWFETLRRQPNLSEVNFWAPSAASFRALQPGEMFLFKLHAPRNAIVGGGIFAYANALPCSLACEAFREANGAHSAQEMRARIARYRRADPADRSDFEIGCRILTQPFFFADRDWIPAPTELVAEHCVVQDLQQWRRRRAGFMGGREPSSRSTAEAEHGSRAGTIWRAAAHSSPPRARCIPGARHGRLSTALRGNAGTDVACAGGCPYPALWRWWRARGKERTASAAGH